MLVTTENGPRIGDGHNILFEDFLIAFLILLAVYSATILYPYLLTDETWIVRPSTYRATLPMGRPLFSLFSMLADVSNRFIGLKVIYLMRISAIMGLALSATALSIWLRAQGNDRFTSIALSVALMTLPAFQIIVADGTQLAWAVLAATISILFLAQGTFTSVLAGALLLFVALAIYQQQALVAFALLGIPLVDGRTDKKSYVFTVRAGGLVVIVSVAYYFCWRVLYRKFWPGQLDTRYGPDAIGIPSFEQFVEFFTSRLIQVGSLWTVNPPAWQNVLPTAVFVAAACLVMFYRRGPRYLFNIALLIGLLIACDSFVLVARSYSSYVTATALSLLVGYCAFASLRIFIGPRVAAATMLTVGSVVAFFTVRNEIAYPNWLHHEIIRRALVENSDAPSFHIIGQKLGGLGYQEFGWRNSATDVYLYLMAVNVADDLVKSRVIPLSRRNQLFLSIDGTGQVVGDPQFRARKDASVDVILPPL